MTAKTTTATTTTATTAAGHTSYAAAYATLAEIAERLKGPGTAASIDLLAQDVVSARRSFALAKGRLDAIRAEIDAELSPRPEGTAG